MSGNFKIGSVLEKIEAGVNTALKFGEKALIDQVKKAQNTITVVYDRMFSYETHMHTVKRLRAIQCCGANEDIQEFGICRYYYYRPFE